MAKGCVVPADGTTKKCFLRVIKTKKGDITRRDNANENKIQPRLWIHIMKKIYLILTFIIAMLSALVLIYIILKLISLK